ncbi:MAG: iron transporter substrate-binding protein [Pseudomonadota bacterium]|jgi:iron(III) transport system substrate-binding protein
MSNRTLFAPRLSFALLGLVLAACGQEAAAPAAQVEVGPYSVTPELIAAATAEGTVSYYTSLDLVVAERMASVFEAKYPGIDVRVERAGSERVFQRIGQESAAGIHNADVTDTSDAVHFAYFKHHGLLAHAVPDELSVYPADVKDPDGFYAAFRADLSVIAYNETLVAPEDVPTGFADLLDPKWRGRMVKGHPGYSGTIMTATHTLSEVMGWEYFAALGQQDIMQVQSSNDPPKKLALGERALQVDGNEYVVVQQQLAGVPLKIVYAVEGTPLVVGNAAILRDAPHPNAARLFYAFMFTLEAQQQNSDIGAIRSFHPEVVDKSGRPSLNEIKLLYSNPDDLETHLQDIRQRYEEYFGT